MRGNGVGPADDGPDASPVSVRLGTLPDATSAATLHARLISEGFLSSLGARFLTLLYGRIARAEGSFLVMAEAEGSPIGFIAGSVDVGGLYRSFLLRDSVVAALSAPLRLLTAVPSVLETLRHGRDADQPAGGELLAVAVDPRWRGRHVGQLLVEEFIVQLERRGHNSAHVVVGSDNAPAIAMYGHAGFRPARTLEMHRGTPSLLMERGVPSTAPPDTGPRP
ncbi:MAG TPA: GNAT family N-acetyltransferase [Acidimicrobiales bacterium]